MDVLRTEKAESIPDLSANDSAMWKDLCDCDIEEVASMTPADVKSIMREAPLAVIITLVNRIRHLRVLWRQHVSGAAKKKQQPLQVEFASGQWFILKETAVGCTAEAAAARVSEALEADCAVLLTDGSAQFQHLARLINWDVHTFNWRGEHLEFIRTVPAFVEAPVDGDPPETLFKVEGTSIKLKTELVVPESSPSLREVASVKEAIKLLVSVASRELTSAPVGDSVFLLDWETNLAVAAFLERNRQQTEPSPDGFGHGVIARVVPYVPGSASSRRAGNVVRVSPKPQGPLPARIKDTLVSHHLEAACNVFTFKSVADVLAAYKYFRLRGFTVA